MDIPPAAFDRPAEMIIWQFEADQVENICRRIGGYAGEVQACAVVGHDPCIIILPHEWSQALYRHERAHCNGWVHR